MPDDRKAPETAAPVERRVAALEHAFEERNLIPAGFIDDFARIVEEDWAPANGAKVVARAWTDEDFRQRLLANGKAAVAELGLTMPEHHKHLVVLENTPSLQNVICCTLCSCTAFTSSGCHPVGIRTSSTARGSSGNHARFARDGPRPARCGRDQGVGHHRRHALHGAAGTTARDDGWPEDKLAAIVTKEFDDRRGSARSRISLAGGWHGRHA